MTPEQPDTPPVLERALHHASEWLASLDTIPVGATTELATLRARLNLPLPERGTDPTRMIDDLVAQTAGGHNASACGRFYAWVIGGVARLGARRRLALRPRGTGSSGLFAVAPAAAVVEEVAGAWIKELLDLPREASFAFTTGCQMAHFTCLASARHAQLQRQGWDVARDGLSGAPAMRILMSDQRHSTIDRAARFLGLRDAQPRNPAHERCRPARAGDARQRTRGLEGPEHHRAQCGRPQHRGVRSVREVDPIARASNAWVHIDGAFGLIARASRRKHALMAGVEAADSWATDGHKWLNVPFDCGIAIVRDRRGPPGGDDDQRVVPRGLRPRARRAQLDAGSLRRRRLYTVYAAIRELGREGLEALVDRSCEHCRAIVTGIGGLKGAEALWVSELNQGLVRFRDPRAGATEEDHDQYTDLGVITGINATGEAFFSGTTWRGRLAMRVSVVNWRTSERDVSRAIAAARSVLASFRRCIAAFIPRRRISLTLSGYPTRAARYAHAESAHRCGRAN